MSQVSDAWYIRLPDGRVLRAANTAIVRTHLHSGRIPEQSRVCRGLGEEWVGLEWTEEFADLVKQADREPAAALPLPPSEPAAPRAGRGVSARVDPARLQTVGVQGLVDELLAALDSTLLRNKIVTGCVAGILSGVALAFARTLSRSPALEGRPVTWLAAGLGILIVCALCNTLLAQMTFVELSRLRPAKWSEATAGLLGLSIRVLAVYLVAAALPLVAIRLVRALPGMLLATTRPSGLAATGQTGADVVTVMALLLEVILWPLLSFAFLVAPVIVVEEHSVLVALREWWRLLREQIGRVFLYEALAITLGTIATLPFCIPLGLVVVGRLGGFDQGTEFGLYVIAGVALAPLIAYLGVANVFIYLNVRYEYIPRYR